MASTSQPSAPTESEEAHLKQLKSFHVICGRLHEILQDAQRLELLLKAQNQAAEVMAQLLAPARPPPRPRESPASAAGPSTVLIVVMSVLFLLIVTRWLRVEFLEPVL
ncbi:MAG: hypothetical protein Q8P67_19750 [archaeon]|nr:hypothetical protein [archaeon]